ncbi:type II secretion system secretin GspD [Zavarzinia aquatilis]|uniref:Type II secretion system protein GspD n=1 Tax=Zavarzinia aquatilis TaxID=2211142 RepID=A0A317E9B3_9PROT|nr:type II secretion system secretin GspD [Zavarzinia aquatilis]PWR22816.1 type II secretion system protein GspD [Zavarzinia aquatilis]
MTSRKALGTLTALALALAGCDTTGTPQTEVQGATVVGNTVPAGPRPLPGIAPGRPDDGYQPLGTQTRIIRGTGQVLGAPAATNDDTAGGDVSLNFTNAEVRDVAKAVLGDILGLTYAVDPEAQGQITIETAQPIRRDRVLPTLEAGLQAAQLILIREGNLYTIMPAGGEPRSIGLLGPNDPGTGTEAIPLRFVSATALKDLLAEMVPNTARIEADAARNILLVSGSSVSRRSLRELAQQFDVDWLRGVSFALIVPQWTDSRNLVEQLTQLLNAEGVPTAGTIRFVPVQQVNGILAISNRAEYLDRVRTLVEMLDREAQGSRRRLFVYRVQNGRASDLAKVLASAFGAGKDGGTSAAASSPSSNAGSASLGGFGTSTASTSGLGQTGATDGSLPTPPTMPGIDGQGGGAATGLSVDLGEAEGAVNISADEISNSIVIHAKPQQYEIVADALRKLDVLPLQVMIESAVTEVTLNNDLRYGVQWFFQTGNSKFSLSEFASGAIGQVFPGFSYLVSNGDSITSVLNALAGVTNINVVSAPKLLVLNNQTASLQVGDQVPVATQSAESTDTSTARIVNSIEYRDTGIILRITPRVNDSGVVLLDISQEVSNVVKTTTSALDSPTIQQRRVASSVAVEDGQTIALGGLITETNQSDNSGLPYLRNLPFLGPLFGTTTDSKDRTELLILLTPRVVRNAADAQRITDELREKIRSVKPLPAAPSEGLRP